MYGVPLTFRIQRHLRIIRALTIFPKIQFSKRYSFYRYHSPTECFRYSLMVHTKVLFRIFGEVSWNLICMALSNFTISVYAIGNMGIKCRGIKCPVMKERLVPDRKRVQFEARRYYFDVYGDLVAFKVVSDPFAT